MGKIRVLHVFDCFRQGGIENFVMNVYRNIDREKIQFDFAFVERIDGVFDDEAKAMGSSIYHYDTEERTLANYSRSLRRILKENGPYDAVHSHIYFFSGVVLSIARSCGVPIRIAHAHDTEKGKKKTLARRSYELLMRGLIHRNATRMLCCSDLAGRYVFGGEKNYTVLYNGIDTDRFAFRTDIRQRLRKELGLEDSKVLLNVGRFNEQKNHFFLLAFFRQLVERDPSFKLILIGTGNRLDDIKQFIAQNRLDAHVIILSNIMNVEDYYCASDCFVLPSRYEGMPIVSVEAQCSGLPAILSDRITREVHITDIMSYLGIDGTEAAWCDAVADAVKRDVRREEYAQKIRGSKFDIHETVRQLEGIYSSAER